MTPTITSRARRFLVTGFASAALVATLFVAGASGPTLASAGAATPPCATSQLVVWLNTEGNGAAGSSYYDLNFTNLASHACTLVGYPGVAGVSNAGAVLGSPAGRSNAVESQVITLAASSTAGNADQSATAILQITVAGNFPNAACHQRVAAGLRVYPPGSTAAKTVPFPFDACAKSGSVYLHVVALTKYQSQQ